jgi:ATP-binding cassette, subfamily C (CFTR/MRP), member 1
VFEGTLRDNLDPARIHDDVELWKALELAHLKDHVKSMEGALSARITEGGGNLSSGQRSLMCLARALLTPSRILVLDEGMRSESERTNEATASVDVETDKLLQETIRSEFVDRTILTIAHRINTIMDSDRILVLSDGKVVEFDTPEQVLPFIPPLSCSRNTEEIFPHDTNSCDSY